MYKTFFDESKRKHFQTPDWRKYIALANVDLLTNVRVDKMVSDEKKSTFFFFYISNGTNKHFISEISKRFVSRMAKYRYTLWHELRQVATRLAIVNYPIMV